MDKKTIVLGIGLCICHCLLQAIATQNLVSAQAIRGKVTDAATGVSMPGVTIIVLDGEPLIGTTTDPDGMFRLELVPAGRHTLRFTFVGYEPYYVRNLLVTSARESLLDVAMRESVTEMEELVIRPDRQKDQPINYMAVSSSRLISMEEASRYAGGFDDPAALARAFAGVTGSLSDNAVVIRGNAPKGVQWLMEGMEIPTPSHFGNIVTIGGGGITALSTHMIADSDFFTGAFPAEYGNALSGIFDLNLRSGNNRQYEHAAKASTIGLDFASEGPIPASQGGSYLFNYRYSTFSLLGPLLPEDAEGIRYQNLSFKINLPAGKAGTFSFWGIGANDWSGQSAKGSDQSTRGSDQSTRGSGQSAKGSPENWTYNQDREKIESPTRFGAAGLRHRMVLGARAWLTTSFAASGNGLRYELDRYTDDGALLSPREHLKSETGKLALKSVVNIRVTTGHTNRSGFTVSRLGYHQQIRFSEDPGTPLQTITDESGHTFHYQAFTQSRIDFHPFSVTAGAHVQHYGLTGSHSFEPRAGLQYLAGKNLFRISYGRHSQAEPIHIYFSHPDNRNLGLTRADHFVAGYSRMLTSQLRLNVETYYQYLSNVPVIPDSSFSTINLELDWLVRDRMAGDGAGQNYGIEWTLERFFSGGWYGLLSGSLFESKYRGGDDIWRDTRFNRNYAATLLAGKEWEFRGQKRVRMFGISGQVNVMGGKRISPVDEARSHKLREVRYDEDRAFSRKEPPVLYAHLTLEYRSIARRFTSTWSLQLLNLTGYREFYGYRYNLRENRIDEEREMIMIPNLGYKIEF